MRAAVSKRMRIFGALIGLVVAAVISGATSLGAQAVLPGLPGTVQQWNKIAEDTVVGSGAFQGEGEIYMSYESLAVYNAAVAIQGGFEPYGPEISAPSGASLDCAVVEAAYRTLRHYFSSFPGLVASLDGNYAEALSPLNLNGCTSDAGKGTSVGLAAANSIISLRMGDGRLTPVGTTSLFETKAPGPGVWRLTPPGFLVPQTPWLGSVQPFLLKSPGQFKPEPPLPLSSTEWARQFNEVKDYGGTTSTLRTPEQTATARFYTANVIRQFNLAGRDLATARLLNRLQTARLLAMVNTVSADALMSALNAKYRFLFWRPVTAIAGAGVCPSQPSAVTADGYGTVPGFDDGNSATVEDPCWRPLVTTPNHPEYPAAHGTNTSAMAEVFSEFLGTDQIHLDIHGFDAAGPAGNLNAMHHFDTADQLRQEVIGARLWGGIHYRRSSEAGVHLGQKVGHYGLSQAFKPTN
jgi:hypothetical protein